MQLKLIDRLRATCWTPPDYWQTDNSNGLVMVIRNYHWLNSASRTTGSNDKMWQQTQFFAVWPLPLTYNLDQSQASQRQGQPSCQKSRSKVKQFKQESAHRQMDGYTHTDATKRIISHATRSIKTCILYSVTFLNVLTILIFLARSANLPSKISSFFKSTEYISASTGPIFTIFLPYER